MEKEVKRTKEKAITLIALVITIIVLLILAGVTIATLTGDNGILTRATEAKNKTEQAQKDEENILNSYEDKLNEYTGIDWDTVLANVQKHSEQKISTAIGVGTDGRAVNMDLWEFTLLDDGTYALNDEEALNNSIITAGYIGPIIDGKIEGVIPQYIKNDGDSDFIEVTDLTALFYEKNLTEIPKIPSTVTNIALMCQGCSELISVPKIPNGVLNMQATFNSCTSLETAPEIPNSVTNMRSTFAGCTSLITAPKIPNSVTNMQSTFNSCILLTAAPEIPNSVTNMRSTFAGCTSLITAPKIPNSVTNMQSTFNSCILLTAAPEIPNSVTNMRSTFAGCTSLKTGPAIIPSSVTNMISTFNSCTQLQGTIEINANLTEFENYHDCFGMASTANGITLKITGNCPMLNDLVATKSYNSNIIL